MYPTQNVIRPITNSIEHTGMTTSVCDVRYVQSTSCPITCRTSCSVVFRRYLWWISIICSPLPNTGFIAELWNRLYMTHKTPVNKEKAGSICHLMVYTNRVRIESVCGIVTGNKKYPRTPNAKVKTTPAKLPRTTNARSSGKERISATNTWFKSVTLLKLHYIAIIS